jgi:hypothetical protein
MSLTLQWLWVFVVGLPPLVKSGALDFVSAPQKPVVPVTHTPSIPQSPVTLILVAVLTIAILVLAVYILIRIPKTIAKTGEQLIQQTSQVVLPVLTHHKALPAKKRRVLSRRLRLAVQIVLSLIPIIVCLMLPDFEELSKAVASTMAIFLGIISLLSFSISWLIKPSNKSTSQTRSHAFRG